MALSTQRIHSNIGPQPLQFGDIRAYGEIVGLSRIEQEFMLSIILSMDAVFLEDRHRRLAEEQKRNNRANKRTSGRQREVIATVGR